MQLGFVEAAEAMLVDDRLAHLRSELIHNVGVPQVADQDPASCPVRRRDRLADCGPCASTRRPRGAGRARQLRTRPAGSRQAGGRATRTVPAGAHPHDKQGTPRRPRRVRLSRAAARAARRWLGSRGHRIGGRPPVHHTGLGGEPRMSGDRAQLGGDRRAVHPPRRHATGHRTSGGPVLDPRPRASRRTVGGPPGLLSGGPARPGRHQSLEPLVAWSYELLDHDERRLLARLSVLRGGFELDTAERVAAGGPLAPQAIAGLLAGLVDRSVVQIQTGATVRYSRLETIRQFAAGRLTVEQANMRATLSWAFGSHEPEAGRELAARLARWWIATGCYSEGGQFLTMALGIPAAAAPDVQARVLLGAAWSAYNLGDNPRAVRRGLCGEPNGSANRRPSANAVRTRLVTLCY